MSTTTTTRAHLAMRVAASLTRLGVRVLAIHANRRRPSIAVDGATVPPTLAARALDYRTGPAGCGRRYACKVAFVNDCDVRYHQIGRTS